MIYYIKGLYHLHANHAGHNTVVEQSFNAKGAIELMETSDSSTITGVFRERAQADQAVEQLKQAGFREDQIQATSYHPTQNTKVSAEEEIEGVPHAPGLGGVSLSRFVVVVNAEGREHEALGFLVSNGANNSDLPPGMVLEHGALVSEQGESVNFAPIQGIVDDPGANTFFGEVKEPGIEENINMME
jgi:hypothetical protein